MHYVLQYVPALPSYKIKTALNICDKGISSMLTFFFFNYLSLLASIYVPNIPFLIRVYRSCIIPFKEKEIRVKNRCIEYDLISKKTSLYIFQVALHLSHAPITLCRETSMSVLPVSGVADKAQSERREEETTRCIFSQHC